MNKILDYELFIFDFDGTIMDTEHFHCKAWNKAISEITNKSINLTISEFHKYFHQLNNKNIKLLLKTLFDIENYDNIYKLKQNYYQKFVEEEDFKLINGVDIFLNMLIDNNKKFVIVTNTSNKFIDIFKIKFPILTKSENIYTKESFINKKPNPECYLYILNKYKDLKKIGFEDSLVGIHALYQINEITPVLIYDKNYYYTNEILNKYNNVIPLENYNITDLNNNLLEYTCPNDYLFIDKILNNNIDQLNKNFKNMQNIIYQITTLINNLNEGNHIYLSGMGKSGYVCKKSASTWQSLSIKCSYIDLPNLPHGDFGVFNANDILILISNSGNTEEIIYILKYIKYDLKKNINTISIVANKNSEMEKLSNFTYILDDINESDNINMTPSTSSLIFMALLDGIAINLKKNITKDDFKLSHPGGSLGKK